MPDEATDSLDMTTKNPYYDPAKFAEGSAVRIIKPEILDNFFRTWKHHHKLEPEQLKYAGQTAKIESSAMYHGRDILYKLKNIPGIWHEQCLETALQSGAEP